ncbi:MAG: RHS repeat-associated core domain-containing protein, partial [Pseudomonadota bacterium]
YDPVIGRFLSNDPVSFTGSGLNPQMFNRYSYTLNDPINAIDPTGKFTIKFGLNLGFARIIAGGVAGGVYIGTRDDGSWTWGTYETVSAGAGVGVDISGGISVCPLCNVDDISGGSLTLSGKKLAGVEVSVPFEADRQDLDFSKTSIGFSFGASAEATITIDETFAQERSGNGNTAQQSPAQSSSGNNLSQPPTGAQPSSSASQRVTGVVSVTGRIESNNLSNCGARVCE